MLCPNLTSYVVITLLNILQCFPNSYKKQPRLLSLVYEALQDPGPVHLLVLSADPASQILCTETPPRLELTLRVLVSHALFPPLGL